MGAFCWDKVKSLKVLGNSASQQWGSTLLKHVLNCTKLEKLALERPGGDDDSFIFSSDWIQGISQLEGVKTMRLSECMLKDLGEEKFTELMKSVSRMKSLVELDLSFNVLNDISFDALKVIIGELKDLKRINLSNCDLVYTDLMRVILGMKKLTHLTAQNNRLTPEQSDSLLSAFKLEHMVPQLD